MALKPFGDFNPEMYIWGQLSLLLGTGLASVGEVREALFAIASDDDRWATIPIALQQMADAMPVIAAGIDAEVALRQRARGQG